MSDSVARIEALVNAISNAGSPTGGNALSPANPARSRALWRELLASADTLLGAAADVRSCAALVQSYSTSRTNLELVVQLMAQAASLEDALLRSAPAYSALLPPAGHDPNTDGGDNHDGDSDGPNEDDMRARRLFDVLMPRFLREGYHPADPRVAYAVALSREEKEFMLAGARRRERAVLAALRSVLGAAAGGAAAASPGGGGGAIGGGQTAAVTASPPVVAIDPAAAAAASGTLSYDWPSYELTSEELAEDAVLAEVAAAQWGARSGSGGGETAGGGGNQGGDSGGGGGGSLLLTLDACGALLQRHPDPVLTDLGALMAGVSSWLADFLGVQLRRPTADCGPPDGGGRPGTGGDGGDGGEGGDGGADLRGAGGTRTAPQQPGAPYDVSVMLRELCVCYAGAEDAGGSVGGGVRHNSSSSSGIGWVEGGGGANGGGGGEAGLPPGHRGLALAAVWEAAAREPRRFLAYRVSTEGESAGAETPQRQVDALESAENGGAGQPMTAGSGPAVAVAAASAPPPPPPVRWLLIDSEGGFGTRFLVPPLGCDDDSGRGVVAAVVVGLQAGGSVRAGGGSGGGGGVDGRPLLTRGSEFMVWELLHELGHAVHFLLAAAPPQEVRSTTGAKTAATSAPPGDVHPVSKRHQGARPLSHALLPYQLPLELVELPSSFLYGIRWRMAVPPESR